MQEIQYSVFRTQISDILCVYGVSAKNKDGEIGSFQYISASYRDAVALCERLMGCDISPVHLGDIVRDYLTELYYRKLELNGLA